MCVVCVLHGDERNRFGSYIYLIIICFMREGAAGKQWRPDQLKQHTTKSSNSSRIASHQQRDLWPNQPHNSLIGIGVYQSLYIRAPSEYIFYYILVLCVCVRCYVCYQGVCVCAIPKHYIHQARVRCRRIEAQNQYITPTNLNLKIKLPSACQDNVFV